MGPVACFIVEDTGREQRYLRRHAQGPCPGSGHYHNAQVPYIFDVPVTLTPEGFHEVPPDQPDRSDPRWPVQCAQCAYMFVPTDTYQVFCQTWYARDTGERFLIRELPAGAMYDAWWMPYKGPDGKSWTLILPDGIEWMIDGPSKGGGRWTRTGVAPKLTVRPSILTSTYHGWLTDGQLVPC